MRILGLDPGLDVTGYGVIDSKGGRIECVDAGAIKSSRKKPLEERLLILFRSVEGIIKDYSPDIAVIEELYAHYKHPATAILMGHARAAICLACTVNNTPIQGYKPTRIKKAIVGKGNATKEQVSRMVCAHLNLVVGDDVLNDVTDALAMAVSHAFIKSQDEKRVQVSGKIIAK